MWKFQQIKLALNVVYKVKRKTFIQCFEHTECITSDIFNVLGNE